MQIGAELLCKSAKVNLGVGAGAGVGVGKSFRSRVSAVGFRSLVPRCVNSDSGTGVVCLPLSRPLPLEILLHLCTGRRPICTFAHLLACLLHPLTAHRRDEGDAGRNFVSGEACATGGANGRALGFLI